MVVSYRISPDELSVAGLFILVTGIKFCVIELSSERQSTTPDRGDESCPFINLTGESQSRHFSSRDTERPFRDQ